MCVVARANGNKVSGGVSCGSWFLCRPPVRGSTHLSRWAATDGGGQVGHDPTVAHKPHSFIFKKKKEKEKMDVLIVTYFVKISQLLLLLLFTAQVLH